MKKEYRGFIIPFLFLFLFWTEAAFGQKTFETEEKHMLQKYRVADVQFQKGRDNFNKVKYDKAEKEFQECLKVMPEHSEALFYLAQIELKRGNFDQALTNIEKAEENYHLLGEFYTWLHVKHLEALRDEKDDYQQQLGPLQSQLALARTQAERQQIQTSIDYVNDHIKIVDSRLNEPLPSFLNPPADYYYFHGNILFKLKRYAEADVQYIEAVKANPKHGYAYNNLINLHYMAKDYEGAVKFLNQAEANGVTINPGLKEAVLKAAGK